MQQVSDKSGWSLWFLLFVSNCFLWFFKNMCMSISLTCISVYHVYRCLQRIEGCQILWNCSCRWLWAALWGLGIKSRFPVRAVSACNHRAISPDFHSYLLSLAFSILFKMKSMILDPHLDLPSCLQGLHFVSDLYRSHAHFTSLPTSSSQGASWWFLSAPMLRFFKRVFLLLDKILNANKTRHQKTEAQQ